ncbi:MAG TPA: UDP-N-acetylglucosamine 1-carboxyvinyltransferase [Candidatus Dojkabacteria bacterium]|nr:UDP-N-acetylglucosamine 1-carboxyvinyltransferase [Candidatus Dojkabacteria bacterium]HQF36844.1 UDP-N-acetylglucosamine 1-carboxyvinyltransferase [Candidatus Dojkabacteria bacterium]
MSTFQINGGKPLNGTITPQPNKNSILAIIPACVLASKPITLHNVPQSSSVNIMTQLFEILGGKVTPIDKSTLVLDASNINSCILDDELADKERASLMFLGPLLARFKKAEIKSSGGCKLGNRPLDTFFQGISALGVSIDKSDKYRLTTNGLIGNENIWLLEASVTGTENLVLGAVTAKGKTIIYNSACEPHVQDMCNFLNSIGAKIKGIGTNRIEIEGVKELSGGEWTIIPDHIDIGGLIVASAITGGNLRIKDAIPQHMSQVLNFFSKVNLNFKIDGNDILIPAEQELVCKRDFKGNIDKVNDQPWPGYPVDLIPQALVLALKAPGNMRIYSNMYETQLMFFEMIRKMRGELIMANPHQVITFGPTEFKGAKVVASDVIQAAHALLLVALSAEGTTTIDNIDNLYRRYPTIVENLNSLGAEIQISD